MASNRTIKVWQFFEQPVGRTLAYYVLLFAGTAVLVRLVPATEQYLNASAAELSGSGRLPGTVFDEPVFAPAEGLPQAAVVAMLAAFLLMLPVAWIYILTRRRKGFRQSVVQTILILPITVAGIVMVVKNSLALAFSLGGIVAAVTFRNTLRDTKDAVYIFLATGIGLASGVSAVGVAAALSVMFNAAILLLWYTDFGRAPAELQGPPADRRLHRALALANRTNAFVSMVDREILRSLTPDQLEAFAERARRRRAKAAVAAGDVNGKPATWRTLTVQVRGEPAGARRVVESLLASMVKAWEFVSATPAGEDEHVLEYRVRLKKRLAGSQLVDSIRTVAAAQVAGAEIR